VLLAAQAAGAELRPAARHRLAGECADLN
jgi:hypothetical protein